VIKGQDNLEVVYGIVWELDERKGVGGAGSAQISAE